MLPNSVAFWKHGRLYCWPFPALFTLYTGQNKVDSEIARLLCNDLAMWRQWSQAASIAGYDLAAQRMLNLARQLEKNIEDNYGSKSS
jgi:hypothetical protein